MSVHGDDLRVRKRREGSTLWETSPVGCPPQGRARERMKKFLTFHSICFESQTIRPQTLRESLEFFTGESMEPASSTAEKDELGCGRSCGSGNAGERAARRCGGTPRGSYLEVRVWPTGLPRPASAL